MVTQIAVGREMDCLVAEKVMGWRVERVRPSWYPVEVLCFYEEWSRNISYTYDERSCNAMLYRNGVDDSNGTAPPLPQFSEDIAATWTVVERLQEQGWHLSLEHLRVVWVPITSDITEGEWCWRARFWKGDPTGVSAVEHDHTNMEAAICHAALKV